MIIMTTTGERWLPTALSKLGGKVPWILLSSLLFLRPLPWKAACDTPEVHLRETDSEGASTPSCPCVDVNEVWYSSRDSVSPLYV